MNYKHINDCWNAIRDAQSINEIEKLFKEFPRWSGDWSVEIEQNSYVVYNIYEDKNMGEQVDCETLDLEIE